MTLNYIIPRKNYPNLHKFCKENCNTGAYKTLDYIGGLFVSHVFDEKAKLEHRKRILETRKEYCDNCLATLMLKEKN